MKKLIMGLVLSLTSLTTFGQTAYNMSSGNYSLDFADIANWTNDFASGIGASNWKSVAINATGTIPNGIKTTSSTATFVTGSSGGVQKGSAQTVPTTSLVFLSTGATDNSTAVAADLFLDFTGRNAGTLSFDWATVFNSTGDRKGSLRVYTSTDGNNFTELTGAQVLNSTNNVAGSGSITSVSLPASFNNSSSARIRFYYHNGTGGTTGSRPKISVDNISITSTSANLAPTATSVSFSGTLTQGQLLTGSYTYNDNEGDLEGSSTYKWYASDDASGTNKTAIGGATNSTFTLTASEVGKFISFEVTPVASTGTTTGAPVESAINASSVQASSNSAPVAADVQVSGTLTEGETLSGTYTYADIDDDAEGTSTFKWYRSNDNLGTGKTAISGATSTDYTLTVYDANKYISFEVTPIAQTGTTNGTPVESAYNGPIGALPNDSPIATEVDISGNLVEGQTLTGFYTYYDTEDNSEGTSTFKWYRADDESGTNKIAIPSATSITYQLVAADIGKFISFEVTPKASIGSINGTPVESPVYGIVIGQPVLTIVGTVPSFGSVGVGESSAEKFYKVHGSNLLSDLVITAPTSFEVSFTSGSGFGSSLNLTPNSGTVDTTVIYVRFSPSALGSASGNITHETTMVTTQNVAVSGTGALALPLTEDFSYADGSALSANGWTAHSGAGTNPVSVGVSNGLTYSHYDGSGVGNAALVNNTGEDVSLIFGAQTSGYLYASFLVNVNAIPTSGYFAHLAANGSTFTSRIYVKNSTTPGKINFGLSNTSAVANYDTPTDFNDSTTYLVMVKYDLEGSHEASLWVFNSTVPANEIAAGLPIDTTSGGTVSSVDRFALRQFNAGQKITVDGLKVATSWIDANLPDNNPVLKSLTRTPFIPNPSQDVVITATATDDWAVTAVGMQYRINNGTFNMVWFNHVSDSTYTYTINESEINNGDYLEYYLFVDDDGGHEISTAGTMSKVFVGTVDIADVRSNDEDGVNNYIGAYANVTGVASVATGIFGAANMNFYIQDATAGINVFKTDVVFSATRGNHYSVIGMLNQISGNLVITPSDVNTEISDLGPASLPASKDHIVTIANLLTNPEDYEGELVTLANVHKTSGSWPVSAGFVNVYVKDANNTDSLAIRIKVATAGTEPVGNFSVEGVFNQLDLTSPYTSGYQLQPRASTDFTAAGAFDFVYIPDTNLKNALLSSDIDNNVDGEITYTEALALTSFSAGENGISDLTGLEAFTNLTNLELPANSIETADLSALVNLTSVHLGNNSLTSVNLSGLSNLASLYLNNNYLTSLNINDLSALELLNVSSNNLSDITYSEHPSLTTLFLDNNPDWEVKDLDLSEFTNLEDVDVNFMGLTSLNVTGLESLYRLIFYDNSIESIDLSTNISLGEIDGSNNPLTTLDLSLNTGITAFYFTNNTLLGDVFVAELPFSPELLDTTGSHNIVFKVFTVPVEMKSFTVSASGSSAHLEWSTASESNNLGWDVERSMNGASWTKIGFVAGKGTTTEMQSYSFNDNKITGKAEYRLKQIDADGKATYSRILSFEIIPATFSVSNNYPNPFNPTTNLRFDLPKTSNVKIVVSNILGQQVAVVADREFSAGINIEVPFNAAGLASGLYYYTITVENKSITKTMMLMK